MAELVIQEEIKKYKMIIDSCKKLKAGFLLDNKILGLKTNNELRLREQDIKIRFCTVMLCVFDNVKNRQCGKFNSVLETKLQEAGLNWITNMEEQVQLNTGDWNESEYLEICNKIKYEIDFVKELGCRMRR